MQDLEITKLCARAMTLKVREREAHSPPPCPWPVGIRVAKGKKAPFWYSPLYDDKQTMGLIKTTGLSFKVITGKLYMCGWYDEETRMFMESASSYSINRAVCECVAKVQAEREEENRRFGQPHYGEADVQT